MNKTIFTQENFKEIVLDKEGMALVLFSTGWDFSSKKMEEKLECISMTNDFLWGTVDIDVEDDLAEKYNITGVPTFIKFVDGKEVDRFSGNRKEEEIIKFIEE